jgi:hypothetical protein
VRSSPSAVLVATFAAIAIAVASAAAAQESAGVDPFTVLAAHRGAASPVPPRALAVIPERHTDRLIRFVDVLVAIDPQFDDLATGAGLDGRRAVQLRTQEARVPIFVRKDEPTVATLLQVPIGARIQLTGVLVPRGSRYLFLAAEVRPAVARPVTSARPSRPAAGTRADQ